MTAAAAAAGTLGADSFTYDALGRVRTHEDGAGMVTTYDYHDTGTGAAGQLRSASFSTGGSISYGFDVLGRRTTMTDPTGTTFYDYDDLDRTIARVRSVNATRGDADDSVVRYGYDVAGRATSLAYPDGELVELVPDGEGRLARLSNARNNVTAALAYHPTRGLLETATYSNGVSARFGYDDAARLTSLTYTRGENVLASFAYTLDAVGRTTMLLVSGPGGVRRAERYAYDELSRLVEATYSSDAVFDAADRRVAYEYDGNGKRLSMTTYAPGAPAELHRYVYGASNRLVRVQDGAGTVVASYTYDGAGRRSSKTTAAGTTRYGYEARGLLASVTGPGVDVRFTYDGDGYQISKAVNGVVTRAVYDSASGRLLQERSVSGAALRTYVWAGPALVLLSNGRASVLLSDLLQSPRLVTDDAGNLTSTVDYDAYGSVQGGAPPPGGQSYGFAGAITDRDVGLVYMRARYYDPEIGQFISPDPSGAQGGTYLYGYAAGDPVNSVDPDGERPRYVNLPAPFPGFDPLGNPSQEWVVPKGEGPPPIWVFRHKQDPRQGGVRVLPHPDSIFATGLENSRRGGAELADFIYATGRQAYVDYLTASPEFVDGLAERIEANGYSHVFFSALNAFSLYLGVRNTSLYRGAPPGTQSNVAPPSPHDVNPVPRTSDAFRGVPSYGKMAPPAKGIPYQRGRSILYCLGPGCRRMDVMPLERKRSGLDTGVLFASADTGIVDAGGVLLDKAATLIGSNLSDIRGATYDPSTHQIVFLGSDGASAVRDLDIDYFYTAVGAVYGSSVPPLVSLDSPAVAATAWSPANGSDGDGLFESGESEGFKLQYNPLWSGEDRDVTVYVGATSGAASYEMVLHLTPEQNCNIRSGSRCLMLLRYGSLSGAPAGVTVYQVPFQGQLPTGGFSLGPKGQVSAYDVILQNVGGPPLEIKYTEVIPDRQHRRFGGRVDDTRLGWVMFEADRVMKSLAIGKDSLTGASYSSQTVAVPGYRSIAERMASSGSAREDVRMWFVPNELTLQRDVDAGSGRATMVFAASSVALLSESELRGATPGPEVRAFVEHFTANYAQFASLSFPVREPSDATGATIVNVKIFDMLKDAMEAVALARFLRDNQIPLDMWWLSSYQPKAATIPRSIPTAINVQGTVRVSGGAEFFKVNSYVPSVVARSVGEQVAAARPPDDASPDIGGQSWTSATDVGSLKSVSLSAAADAQVNGVHVAERDLAVASPGDNDLALYRVFDSNYPADGPLGRGWQLARFALEFSRPSWFDENGLMRDASGSPLPTSGFDTGLRSGQVRFVDRASGVHLEFESSLTLSYTTDANSRPTIALAGLGANRVPAFAPGGRHDGTTLEQRAQDRGYLVRRPDGTTYELNSQGQLTRVTDAHGHFVSYGYQGARLTLLSDDAGQTLSLAYAANGRLQSVSGPQNETVTYAYDAQSGCLASATLARTGQTVRYGCDAERRLNSRIDEDGVEGVHVGLDQRGRAQRVREANGATFSSRFARDPASGSRTAITVDDGATHAGWRDELDAIGRISSHREPTGATTRYGYSGSSPLPTSITVPLPGRPAVSLQRNAAGLVERVTDSGNTGSAPVEIGYTPGGLVQTVKDAASRTMSFAYEPNQIDLKSTTRRLGTLEVVESYGYENGYLRSVTDPLGNKITFRRDSVGRVTGVVSPTGLASGVRYDAIGRIDRYQHPAQIGETTIAYTPRDQIKTVTTPAGATSYEYLPGSDRVARRVNALGHATRYEYDGATGQLVRASRAGSRGDAIESYTYHRLGGVQSIVAADGTVHRYYYDDLGRLLRAALDTDGDGLADVDEIAAGGHPTVADSDGDGLADGLEVSLGTHPGRVDTDGDGLRDGREVALGSDPLRADGDGDGVIDRDDAHPSRTPGSDLMRAAPGESWGSSGAASKQVIAAGQDGYVELMVRERDTWRTLGLSPANSDAGYASIHYAWLAGATGTLAVYESGTHRGTFGSYAEGDVLRIERRAGVITYLHNGEPRYVSTVPSTTRLVADAALYSPTAALYEVVIQAGGGAAQAVAWRDVAGAVVDADRAPGAGDSTGSKLVKARSSTAWGDAGAASRQVIPAGSDGYVQLVVRERDTWRALGLSATNADAGFATIDYALIPGGDGQLHVYERGTLRATVGSYAEEDVLRVERAAGRVTYMRNGALVYTSATPSTGPLVADAALYSPNAALYQIVIRAGAGEVEPVVWRDLVGVAVDGDGATAQDGPAGDLRKVAATSWGNAGGSSQQTIPAGAGGEITFRARERNTHRLVGLSRIASVSDYAAIDHGIYPVASGALYVLERGTARGPFGSYAEGDVLGVVRDGSVVRYTRNGVVVYQSAIPSVEPLFASAALYEEGATVHDVRLRVGSGPPETVRWRATQGVWVDDDFSPAGATPAVVDSDGDGLSDADELSLHGTDPSDADTDDDGLADGQEIARGITPSNPDSDGDGVRDDEDVSLSSLVVTDARPGCPPAAVAAAGETLMERTLQAGGTVVAMITGHAISLATGRRDVGLEVDGLLVTRHLGRTESLEWLDHRVAWVGTLTEGAHFVRLVGLSPVGYGCGSAWGELGVTLVPQQAAGTLGHVGLPPAAVFDTDPRAGCPPAAVAAGTPLFSQTIELDRSATLLSRAHVISLGAGRRDAALRIDGAEVTRHLGRTEVVDWTDHALTHGTRLGPGTHQIDIVAYPLAANQAYGCGGAWGNIASFILPESISLQPSVGRTTDARAACPAPASSAPLLERAITLERRAIVTAEGQFLSLGAGRRDVDLWVDGVLARRSLGATPASVVDWFAHPLAWSGVLDAGPHVLRIVPGYSSQALAGHGCGEIWGQLWTASLPQ